MTSAPQPRRIHVERTPEPAVLRWVCHHPALDSATPGRRQPEGEGPLGALIAQGSITEIVAGGGDVRVRAATPDGWPTLAPRVQAALLAELDALDRTPGHWLTEPVEHAGLVPSISDVQRIVDRAAGTVMAGHGGAMIVTAVDHTTVSLRSEGACDGCRQSSDTILGLIEPAIRSTCPEIVAITLDAVPEQEPTPPFQLIRTSKRLRIGNRTPHCH
ncbi:MAG: NifU family protein [Acidimicrobiales bacterium]